MAAQMAGGSGAPEMPLGELPLAAAPEQPSAWADYETVFTNAKAGMDGVDKDKVKQVVYEMSKGSRFFENEARKEKATKERVERLKQKAAKMSLEERAGFQKAADKKVVELESTRDLSRTWMHVDMDAFYASVEELHDPSLANKPMAVGGMGMICTANYEARKYGVRAAMPGFIGKRLCPQLVFAKPDFQKYTAASKEVQEVLREYDPNFIARSLDEAYLDLTQVCLERNMTASEVAEELRTKVHQRTRLTCSAGIGPNRLLAKVCSDINKPNGQFVLPNQRAAVMSFITSLPTRKVTGIGKVGERVLREVLGVTKCGELLENRAMIFGLFSSIAFDEYMAVGLGIGGSEAPKEEHRKSLSTERTFNTISRDADLITKLHEIAASLADDMAREDLHAKTLTLKLKTSHFEVRQRAVTLPIFISTAEEILPHAMKLLRAEMPISIRLMGLRFSHFKEEIAFNSDPAQKTLTAFLKPATPSAPGQSSGQDPSQERRQTSPGRQPSRDHQPAEELTFPARPQSLSVPGSIRMVDAYVRAQSATAQFVEEQRCKGGRMIELETGGARKKKDVKIDHLLGNMKRSGERREEVSCGTCTFLNRSGAHTCNMCGAKLEIGGMALNGGVETESERKGGGAEVVQGAGDVRVENIIGGAEGGLEVRSEAEGTDGIDDCSRKEDAKPWGNDYGFPRGSLDAPRFEVEREGDDRGESLEGRRGSAWTASDVRQEWESDEEFDVVGSLRHWSEVEEKPRKEAQSQEGDRLDGSGLLREEERLDKEGRRNGGERGKVRSSEGGELILDEGRIDCERLVDTSGAETSGSERAFSPGRRRRFVENGQLGAPKSGPCLMESDGINFRSPLEPKKGTLNGTTASSSAAENGREVGLKDGHPELDQDGELITVQSCQAERNGGQELVADANTSPAGAPNNGGETISCQTAFIIDDTVARKADVGRGSIESGSEKMDREQCELSEELERKECVLSSEPKRERSGELGREKCEMCGKPVPESGPGRQEHEDYHVALELYKEEGGRLQPVQRQGGNLPRGAKRAASMIGGEHRKQRRQDQNSVSAARGTLDTFLKKRT